MITFDLICLEETFSLFGSLEREGSTREESSGEWLSSTLFGCF